MILEVCRDGLWTLSFGLSQFRGHGSWLVCEVALRDWLCFLIRKDVLTIYDDQIGLSSQHYTYYCMLGDRKQSRIWSSLVKHEHGTKGRALIHINV